MKRIVIVNHYWPPTGGPCVQRWLDFSACFVSQGYLVTVVTPENPGFPFTDESLLNRVDSRVNVVKLGYRNRVSGTIKTIGNNFITRFIRGNFFLPDPRMNWNKLAIAYINEHLSEFDVIITAGPPHSTHFIGLAFKNKLKWIADFHDYWTNALYLDQFYRLWPIQKMDEALEKKILRNADLIFVHCDTAKSIFKKKTTKPVHVIYMGFYDPLFDETTPVPVKKGTVSHIGSFFSSYSDGLTFIKHLSNSGFKVRQVGQIEQNVIFPPDCEIIPYVPHKKAIEYMRESEYLLLVNPYPHILAGKLFEYLGAGRPILVVSPDGSEIGELVKKNQGRDVQEIYEEYSRTAIAKRVAHLIDEL